MQVTIDSRPYWKSLDDQNEQESIDLENLVRKTAFLISLKNIKDAHSSAGLPTPDLDNKIYRHIEYRIDLLYRFYYINIEYRIESKIILLKLPKYQYMDIVVP